VDVSYPGACGEQRIAGRTRPTITLDRALRYAAAFVTIDGDLGAGPWFVVSGEAPRLSTSRSGQYELSIDGLRKYADDEELSYVTAFGGDPVSGYRGEQSLAFRDISERQAVSIGREFGQEAIFRISEQSQEVLFVKRGRISSTPEQLTERRRLLSLGLELLLSEVFSRQFALPTRVRDVRGWHHVGSPDSFAGVGDLDSQRQIFRTVDDGNEGFEPLSVLVDPASGSVTSRPVEFKRPKDDGSDSPLVSARIHLDNCVFSDTVRGLTEAKRVIYVWKPVDPYPECPVGLTSIYVGETGLPSDERIQRHLNDDKASEWVRDYPNGELEKGLMPSVVLPTLQTSTAFEEWYALYLGRHGYFVKGGH